MKRPATSNIRHGNPACGMYGCKKAECIEAHRAYRRENQRNRKKGVKARVPVRNALEHMRVLLAVGMTHQDMESICGVHWKTLYKILNGRCENIHWTTEEAILGIPVPQEGQEFSGNCLVDAFPADRRLKALGAQGFTGSSLSRESGIDEDSISAVRSGKCSKVRMSTMRAIKEMHDRLYDSDPTDFGVAPGDATRTRNWARNHGWYPTEAWADIDDPDCKPVLNTPRYVVLTEDARELMEGQGYTLEQAADRLGVKRSTLTSARTYYSRVMAKEAS